MKIFISYSSLEKEAALEKRELLINNGFSVWMAPESIPYGENYMSEIPAAIEECDVFLLLLSEKSQNSKWVFREFEMALKLEKTVIPYVLEEIRLTKTYDFGLAGCQFIPAFENPSDSSDRLVERIRQLMVYLPGNKPLDTKENEPSKETEVVEEEINSEDDVSLEVTPLSESILESDLDEQPEQKSGQDVKVMPEKKLNDKIVFPNGDIYIGATEDGIPCGKGEMILADKRTYKGDFKYGLFHGKGILSSADGKNSYEGEFLEGKRNGYGLHIYQGGQYEGNFVNDKRNGLGILSINGKDKYEGIFVNGTLCGMCKQIKKDGGILFGTYKNDKFDPIFKCKIDDVLISEQNGKTDKSGIGEIKFKSGMVYYGRITEGKATGKGKIFYKNGDVYRGHVLNGVPHGIGNMLPVDGGHMQGEFVNGLLNGKGIKQFKNGKLYTGDFKNGVATGVAKIVYKNGDTYEGEVEKGVPNGTGTMTYKTLKESYAGEFKSGVPDGWGVYSWPNGDRFEGYSKKGRRHGMGKFIWASGNVYEGEFFEAKMQGHGKMIYSNGDVCEGEFKNYLFDGEFIVTPAKGTPYKAVFSEGKIVKETIQKISLTERNRIWKK